MEGEGWGARQPKCEVHQQAQAPAPANRRPSAETGLVAEVEDPIESSRLPPSLMTVQRLLAEETAPNAKPRQPKGETSFGKVKLCCLCPTL